MAKLRDLENLIPDIAGVTPARAHVWIMLSRKAGLFTSGGRGLNVPDIGPQDLTNALLLSLQFNTPTEAPEAVPLLRALPFFTVKHDPGDGTFRDLDFDRLDRDHPETGRVLPEAFETRDQVATLGDALDRLFTAGQQTPDLVFRHTFDRITHDLRGEISTVALELADPEHNNGWPEGPKAWRFVFGAETEAGTYDKRRGRFGTTTAKTIHGDALRAMRDLIAGAD